MAKTIPIIITNSAVLVYNKSAGEFKEFKMPGNDNQPNIPFYHSFAKKIAESQHYFKEFVKSMYSGKLTKNIFAIIVPDDTSTLESIFITEFFLNFNLQGCCADYNVANAFKGYFSLYFCFKIEQKSCTQLY